MRVRVALGFGVIAMLAGCGPNNEFPHQTVQAYHADSDLWVKTLQRCADHITKKIGFQTQSDTDECAQAYTGDQNVRLAQHEARKNAASNAALSAAAKQFEGK
jgi:hypothetical protein